MRLATGWAILVLLASLVGTAAPVGAGPIELLSHRAAYRLALRSSDSRSRIETLQGALAIEWRASCEGWISNQRLGFVASVENGPGFSYDARFSSWELLDRTQLRFAMRLFDGDELSEEARGQAALQAPGATGEVHFSLPAEERIALPAGTIFPTEHVRAIIEAARAGQRFVAHDVFDGSGRDGLNRITAVIGEPQAGGDGERYWRVNLAYYPPEASELLPDFQLAFDVTDRGVLDDVVLDYGEFAIEGRLEKLEPLPTENCN